MNVTALAAHTPEAVRAALAARGWEPQPAWFAAVGIQPFVVLIEAISEAEREALVHWGTKSGADVLTGGSGLGAGGWALVAGAASRIAPLARYDRAPVELARLAPELGKVLAARVEPPSRWAIRGADLSLDKPVIIGILNVTPDSFSDGGHLPTVEAAIEHGEQLTAHGARLLDVGGESTRPGATPVPADEEIARVVPVVSGLQFDPALAAVVARAEVGLILMHMRGTPATMDDLAKYAHVAPEVAAELATTADKAERTGIAR